MTRPPARPTVHARKVAAALYSPGDPIPEKPVRAKARDIEGPIHRSILAWLRVALPKEVFVHHSPNGGMRDLRVAQKLKALGVVAGVPDLMILVPGRYLPVRLGQQAPARTFFIEVKAPGGTTSREQVATFGALEQAGAYIAVAHSVDEARDIVRRWGIQVRTTP